MMLRLLLLPAFFLFAATNVRPGTNSRPLPTPKVIIAGSAHFRDQVQQALFLLKTRDVNAYRVVESYVGVIREGKPSGMWAYKNPPTYEMADGEAFSSVTWCAAVIAEQSFYSKLYHDYQNLHDGADVPAVVWTGIKSAQECMAHQLAVMIRIGAPEKEIAYAKTQADGHYVKNHDTWDDYYKRNW